MIDVRNDTPVFYWTFNRLGDLEQGQGQYGFDGSVWKSDGISSYSIGEADVIFDSPAQWAEGLPPAAFRLTLQGTYEHRAKGVVYEAVRADTQTHVVLAGRWSRTEVGNGVFIAVLPLKQAVKVLLETSVAMPVTSTVPEMVSKHSTKMNSTE